WTVLIPAMILTALLDRGGIAAFGLGGPYGGNLLGAHFGPAAPVSQRLDLASFLGSIGFLQGIATQPFGSNFPVWSVVCEFWFYALFPLLLLAATRGPWPRRLFAAIGLGLGMVLLGREYTLYFGYWLSGCVAWWLSEREGSWGRDWLWPAYLVMA